jgi:3-oxoacyl-(acyl-carrier-protein) synthase
MRALMEIVIEQSAVITPFGKLHDTADRLLAGESRITPGPFFGIPVVCAPFRDESLRDLRAAAAAIFSQIDWRAVNTENIAFIFCCAKGDLRAIEAAARGQPALAVPSPLLDEQARTVCNLLPFLPRRIMTVSTACASGAIGIEIAVELLREGACRSVVLFGLDVISRFVITGFHSLNALSTEGARPFDSRRNGLTLGDGAGCAILAMREPCRSECIVAGAGSSNDANHRTGPSRTGEGLCLAAAAALADSRLTTQEIGAVKCHGTATPYNDAMEAKALHRLFGEECPPCVSFKGSLGHMSGAGSLIEILLAAQCLRRRTLPPTAGYELPGVDERIGIASLAQRIEKPAILCLSAGFGGLNAAVIIRERVG